MLGVTGDLITVDGNALFWLVCGMFQGFFDTAWPLGSMLFALAMVFTEDCWALKPGYSCIPSVLDPM